MFSFGAIRESHGLDEQLVQYGRTGIYPREIFTDEDFVQDKINSPPMSGGIRTSTKKPLKATYQLSLDAGLLAASLEEVQSDRHKWKSHQQKTFDAADETKSENKPSTDSRSCVDSARTSIVTPLSASDVSINIPGVSFINQNRNVQSQNNKIRKVVDENDLSSQYNFYRSLSPNNGNEAKPPPRFLKRQFSVDKDENSENKTVRLFKQNSTGTANELGRIDEIPSPRIASPSFSKDNSYKHRNIQPTTNSSSESLNQNS